MKTTVELPDDLTRAIRLRAVREDRRLKDLIAELLWRGLQAAPERGPATHVRVSPSLVRCDHEACDSEELTPARVAQLLADQEAQDLIG